MECKTMDSFFPSVILAPENNHRSHLQLRHFNFNFNFTFNFVTCNDKGGGQRSLYHKF
jgi:hypothetical protein